MAYYIDSVTDSSGSFALAHYNMLEVIKNALDAIANYTILRYVTTGTDYELIVKTTGLSGTEEIFFGFRTYHSVGADYYNLLCATFTGYLAGNTFDTQPGAVLSGVPAHNTLIDYFLVVNEQRINLVMKIGASSVYEHCAAGKFFQASVPSQYPHPIFNAGMLSGAAATRYSDTSHSFPWNPGYLRIRDLNGNWITPSVMPYSSTSHMFYSDRNPVPAIGDYPLLKIEMYNSNGFFGWLDGIYFVSGYSNGAQNVHQKGGTYTVDSTGKTTKQIVDEIIDDAGGRAFVVLPNTYRTAIKDYIAMEMI